MILLISPHATVRECAAVLSQNFGEATDAVQNLDHATSRLRAQEYSTVIFDQALVESEPNDTDASLQHLGTAIPVFINFGTSNVTRVLKEVRSAMMRRRRDERSARESAEQTLRAELKGIVTAMLLSCELALQDSPSAEAQLDRIRSIHELAMQLRTRLSITYSH
jgi:hypothetical protein